MRMHENDVLKKKISSFSTGVSQTGDTQKNKMSNDMADLTKKDQDLKDCRLKVIALEEEIKKLTNAK